MSSIDDKELAEYKAMLATLPEYKAAAKFCREVMCNQMTEEQEASLAEAFQDFLSHNA